MTEQDELVIFDCDGVLVDSEPIAARIDVRTLAEIGWPITTDEVIARFMGRSTGHMLAEVERHLGAPPPADLAATLAHRQRAAFAAELKPVEGIESALDRIAELPVATCVASGGSHEKMRFTLGLTGLYERFDGRIFSADQVDRGKPEPDLFLLAAERMGVSPARCVVVEDSTYGVQAARAAGMRALGYAGGLTPVDRLAGPATVIFHDMHELPDLIVP